jgi:hypothetical protein
MKELRVLMRLGLGDWGEGLGFEILGSRCLVQVRPEMSDAEG